MHSLALIEDPITEADITHRRDFAKYASTNARDWLSPIIPRLYSQWEKWNDEFFWGKLHPPYILVTDLAGANTMGDCSPLSSFGGRSEIRVRDTIFLGTYREAADGTRDPEGLFRLGCDVLLHELCHQYQQEVDLDNEDAWHGHGPKFRDHCNRIGDILGFGRVRTCKKRGADADLPSCSYWPDNVRPDAAEYYLGAWPISNSRRTPIVRPTVVVTEAPAAEPPVTPPVTDDEPAEERVTTSVSAEEPYVTDNPGNIAIAEADGAAAHDTSPGVAVPGRAPAHGTPAATVEPVLTAIQWFALLTDANLLPPLSRDALFALAAHHGHSVSRSQAEEWVSYGDSDQTRLGHAIERLQVSV